MPLKKNLLINFSINIRKSHMAFDYEYKSCWHFYNSRETWGRDMPWETGNQSTKMSFLPEEPIQLHKLAPPGKRTIFSLFVQQTVV